MIRRSAFEVLRVSPRISRCLALWLPVLTLGPVNLFIYRQANSSETRDLGVWIRAAESILGGGDPYSDSGGLFKSGPISPFLLYMIRSVSLQNNYIFFNLVMFLNIIGMAAFLSFFLRYFRLSSIQVLICNSVFILSSFNREVLVTGQVTGLIFGLLALFAFLLERASDNSIFVALAPLTVLVVLVIDFKPNIMLFPLVSLILICRKSLLWPLIISVGITYLFCMSILYIWTKSNLFALWIQNLFGINNYGSNKTLFGTKNLWQILNEVYGGALPSWFFSFVPLSCYVLVNLFGLILVKKRREALGLSFLLLAPFFYSYFHYYSFFPIALVMLVYTLKQKNMFLFGFLVSAYLITYKVSENIGFLGVSLFMLCIIVVFDGGVRSIAVLSLGWFSSTLIRLFLNELIREEILYMSVVLSLLLVTWAVSTAQKQFKVFPGVQSS